MDRKILLRSPNWIGDAVMSLPAVAALKRLFPDSYVSVLAKPRVIPVFESRPDVDAVIEYDDRGAHRGFTGRLKLAGELKKRGFDAAVLFQNAFDAAFIAFISKIPERVGYARDFRRPLLTLPIPATKGVMQRHQVWYYINIVEKFSEKTLGKSSAVSEAPVSSIVPSIKMTAKEFAWAAGFLKEKGFGGKALIGAAPGASYGPAKMWPPERFAATLNALAKKYSAQSLVFGSSEDKAACDNLVSHLDHGRLNLAGELTLRQSMSLMAMARVFVTNDSGPMHLASALGAPTVAIFGSTDPSLTGPSGERSAVVMKKVECSPCFERTCRYGHYNCLTGVSVDDVQVAAARVIEK